MVRLRDVLLLAFVALSTATAPALAQPGATVSSADRAAIATTIQRQVEAFRRDDGTEAFGYASPTIQGMFGTAENFMHMVREGYRAVYRPRSFSLDEVIEAEGIVVQRVSVIDPDGQPVTAIYIMQRQPDGSWRIDGCYLLPPEGETA